MGFDEAYEISLSGVQAQRRVMELIASNLANVNTTRTVLGGPYHRKIAVLGEKPLYFSDVLSSAEARLYGASGGVEVVEVAEDQTPLPRVYKPGHPDADAQGFLTLPNVSLASEMTDLTLVSRLYEANITAFNATKKMEQDTLQIQ